MSFSIRLESRQCFCLYDNGLVLSHLYSYTHLELNLTSTESDLFAFLSSIQTCVAEMQNASRFWPETLRAYSLLVPVKAKGCERQTYCSVFSSLACFQASVKNIFICRNLGHERRRLRSTFPNSFPSFLFILILRMTLVCRTFSFIHLFIHFITSIN